MYRNISVVWMLFFGVKFYELLVVKHQMAVNDVSIIIIALVGAFVCVYNSRRIDRYKQRRIKICFGTDADKLNCELSSQVRNLVKKQFRRGFPTETFSRSSIY